MPRLTEARKELRRAQITVRRVGYGAMQLDRTVDAHRAVENGTVGKVLVDVTP